MDEFLTTMKDFARLFRKGPALPRGLAWMPLLVAVVWPMALIASGQERAAFMLTFVILLALRFAMGADRIIRKLSAHLAPRTAAIVILMSGPGSLALLIWGGEPIWCQRFLSLYFGAMTLLYLSDVLTGELRVLSFHSASLWHRVQGSVLDRMLVVYYMAMLLLNETLIATAGLGAWLVFFAFLPHISQRLGLALVRTANPSMAV